MKVVRCVEQQVIVPWPTLAGSQSELLFSTSHWFSSSFRNMHWVFSGLCTALVSGISILIGFSKFLTSISEMWFSFVETKEVPAVRAEILT